MKLLDFPRIGEQCFEQRLANGMLVRVVPKRGFARKYAFVAVDFGAIDTTFVRNGVRVRMPDGIAHYLEHKMFDLPEGSADGMFAALGASPNAFTSYAMTAYHFSCAEHFADNLRLLLRMVTTPYFTPESVEKERGIITQEIRMYEDNAEQRAAEDLFAALYREHPVRTSIAGTEESIGEISAQSLYDCFRAFYQPSNMVLCVTGDVDAQEVFDIAEEMTPKTASDLPERDYGAPETMEPAEARTMRRMEISMPTFALGFKCEPVGKGMESMRREIIGDLAAEILVGESSPLYQRLYESGLIDGGFSVGYESIKDACLISASGDSDDPEAVLSAILEEAARIAREGFEPDLFRRLKKSALGRRTRDLDSFESICYRICAYQFDGVDYFTFPEAYASVAPEDVRAFLTNTIRPERAVLSVVQPKK
ncbi:MAG: insulinase family protein [Oscillospiraceae bacterium]|nr:insulinase family protein [Oscillospiraceae bacterium]